MHIPWVKHISMNLPTFLEITAYLILFLEDICRVLTVELTDLTKGNEHLEVRKLVFHLNNFYLSYLILMFIEDIIFTKLMLYVNLFIV